MTVVNTGASSACKSWNDIKVDAMQQQVTRLQMRIAKAVTGGKHGKVKVLQWLLTHSFAAKFLAVKRVTETRGRKPPVLMASAGSLRRQSTMLY